MPNSTTALTIQSFSPAWKRVEEHYGAACRFGRQAVEEAWRCGDALIAAKAETKHGEWIPALKAVGIGERTAQDLMRLRREYSEIRKLYVFDSVSAALKAPAHVSLHSGESEWYTPPDIIAAAGDCMGSIELDPASSEKAQETVLAERFFAAEDDGLSQPWAGRVFLNPPYEAKLVGPFVEKLLSEPVEQAIIVVNNATETKWGQALLERADAICFPSGRIKFLDSEGSPKQSPLQGQMIIGIGIEVEAFRREFQNIGAVLCVK